MKPGIAILVLCLLLAACQAQPTRQITQGEELAFYDFARGDSFEIGNYRAATLQSIDHVYRIAIREADNEIWWGQWGDIYENVVIEVEMNQITERNDNAYGLMCRVSGFEGVPVPGPELPSAESAAESPLEVEMTAEPAAENEPAGNIGDGYLFLIQGSGAYSIMRSRSRNLTPLVEWSASNAINVGPGKNTMRAVCVNDYLALYVNDTFLADATDDTLQAGQVGLAASSANRLGITVEFDNLAVYEATADS